MIHVLILSNMSLYGSHVAFFFRGIVKKIDYFIYYLRITFI